MSELRLVGLHDDGEHVVLEAADGQRFRLPIDDALRAAVRRDRPQLEQVRAELTGVVPPREIQARIRAGATAEDLAESAGIPVEMVRRYEGPVLAEREFVAAQAQASRIGRDAGAPVLGDLVTDRLATRGVGSASIRWDAFRSGSAPWTVEVTFEVADATRSARWTYEASTRTLRAVDDEARWLSETEIVDEPIPRRHLAAVRGGVFDVEAADAVRPLLASVDVPAEPEHVEDPHEATHALLDDLEGRRGVRQQVDLDEDDDADAFEGFGPQHAFDFEHPDVVRPFTGDVPAAHPPHSRPDEAVDAQVLEMPAPFRERLQAVPDHPQARGASEHDDSPDSPGADGGLPGRDASGARPSDGPGSPEKVAEQIGEHGSEHGSEHGGEPDVPPPLANRARGRKGRASVPSWDEIVFGARPE